MKQAVFLLTANNKGLYLGVSRKDNHSEFGLPGGKVEDLELLEQALIREVKEETNLNVFDITKIYSGYYKDYLITVFSGKTYGYLKSNEGAIVGWVDKYLLINGPFKEFNTKLFYHLHIL